jgi:hypothetical protein
LAASDLTHKFTLENNLFGDRVFSVAYSPYNGGTLYAVNGPGPKGRKVQGFVIPLNTKSISSVFSPGDRGFGQPHDIAVSKNGSELYVVEISKPYRVWKFQNPGLIGQKQATATNVHTESPAPGEPERRVNPLKPSGEPLPPLLKEHRKPAEALLDADSFSTSVIIMAFLTIPLLLLIGVGALLRLRSSGCCRRAKETKSFSEFFPPSAGFEKLRMDESESDNSDTEVEEYSVSSYRKASA